MTTPSVYRRSVGTSALTTHTAVTGLVMTPIDKLPKRCQSSAAGIRDAIKADRHRELHICCVHSLPESTNVKAEIVAVDKYLADFRRIDAGQKRLKLEFAKRPEAKL